MGDNIRYPTYAEYAYIANVTFTIFMSDVNTSPIPLPGIKTLLFGSSRMPRLTWQMLQPLASSVNRLCVAFNTCVYICFLLRTLPPSFAFSTRQPACGVRFVWTTPWSIVFSMLWFF